MKTRVILDRDALKRAVRSAAETLEREGLMASPRGRRRLYHPEEGRGKDRDARGDP